MTDLRALGMKPGWIYETVVTTLSTHSPHAAPMGVWTNAPHTLEIHMYRGSLTLHNTLERRELVVNFPDDVLILAQALMAPDELELEPGHALATPRLKDAPAAAEVVLRDTHEESDRVRIVADVVHVSQRRTPRLVNRAEHLLLESLVLATRLDRPGTVARLSENLRVVSKVAPASQYHEAMARLMRHVDLES